MNQTQTNARTAHANANSSGGPDENRGRGPKADGLRAARTNTATATISPAAARASTWAQCRPGSGEQNTRRRGRTTPTGRRRCALFAAYPRPPSCSSLPLTG